MRSKVIRKNVELDITLVKWLRSTYPNASLSATLNMLLRQFRMLHTQTPVELAELAAKELKEQSRGEK